VARRRRPQQRTCQVLADLRQNKETEADFVSQSTIPPNHHEDDTARGPRRYGDPCTDNW
jgi:hypothetical protein